MMRQLRFIFIALTTFLFVTSTAFLRRTVSILLCGVLSFNSASCYNFLDKYGKVDAVTPLSSTFALSNPSSSYAYIVRKQELTTPEGCKVVLNTKNIDGKPFPDYFQFIAEDKKTCGNSFTSRVNPNANGVTVSVNTDEGPVIYTIQSVPSEQGSPNQGVKITTNYPDGKTEIYTGESPDNGERYRINYENNSGKNETYTFDVPNDLKPSFANNEQTKPTEKPESEFCRFANEYCHSFEDVSKAFTKFEIAFLSFGILKGLPSRLKSLLPYLNPLDKGLSLLQLPCFLIVGGFPELPYKEIFKKLGVEFGNTVNQPYNEVVGLLYKDRTQEELDKVIDDIRKGTWAEAPCKRLAQAHSTNDPHLVTFDGLKYDLQTVGEFTLIKSNNSDFEVQARQTPSGLARLKAY